MHFSKSSKITKYAQKCQYGYNLCDNMETDGIYGQQMNINPEISKKKVHKAQNFKQSVGMLITE